MACATLSIAMTPSLRNNVLCDRSFDSQKEVIFWETLGHV